MNKVTQKTGASKNGRTTKRTSTEPKEPPDDETTVPIRKYELQRLDGLLARAQDVVMRAAPSFNHGIPSLGLYGNSAAVSAHSDIRMVREEIAKALGVAS